MKKARAETKFQVSNLDYEGAAASRPSRFQRLTSNFLPRRDVLYTVLCVASLGWADGAARVGAASAEESARFRAMDHVDPTVDRDRTSLAELPRQAGAFAGGLDLGADPRCVSIYRLAPDGRIAGATFQRVNPHRAQQIRESLVLPLTRGDLPASSAWRVPAPTFSSTDSSGSVRACMSIPWGAWDD